MPHDAKPPDSHRSGHRRRDSGAGSQAVSRTQRVRGALGWLVGAGSALLAGAAVAAARDVMRPGRRRPGSTTSGAAIEPPRSRAASAGQSQVAATGEPAPGRPEPAATAAAEEATSAEHAAPAVPAQNADAASAEPSPSAAVDEPADRPEPDVPAEPAEATEPAEAAESAESPEAPEPTAPAAALPAASGTDDLTRIDGVGPKISVALTAAGLSTFAAVAAADEAALRAALQASGLRFAPSLPAWPERAARLAADTATD